MTGTIKKSSFLMWPVSGIALGAIWDMLGNIIRDVLYISILPKFYATETVADYERIDFIALGIAVPLSLVIALVIVYYAWGRTFLEAEQ